MCKFESTEVCEPLCFHSKSECTGLRKLVVRFRRGLSAGAAPGCVARWAAGRSFSLQCNAGADAAQARMRCVVTLGEGRRDCFSQCNAGGEAIEKLSH